MRTLIFDTETTDLISNSILRDTYQPRIIEFCGLVYDENEQLIDELVFLCNPGIPIPDKISTITGISDDDVRNQPRFVDMAEQVRNVIETATTIVAHNLSFDMAMIDIEMRRNNLPPIKWPKTQICTVEQTEHLQGRRLTLSALHEFLFGEQFAGAHRARVDVEALARCYFELVKRGEL